jgi:hypothetical protein
MVRRIGLLPASGSASRINGLPKFALPYSSTKSLIQYHMELMLPIVDEIRVCTRVAWAPLLNELGVNKSAEIHMLEPSTMNDALYRMTRDEQNQKDIEFIVGMPDTAWTATDENPYLKLTNADSDCDVTLLLSPFRESLRGKVGQVGITESMIVKEIIDKDLNCNHKNIWTAFRMNGYRLTPSDKSPSHSFLEMLAKKEKIDVAIFDGIYHDLGSMEGIKEFYNSLQTSDDFHLKNGPDAKIQ